MEHDGRFRKILCAVDVPGGARAEGAVSAIDVPILVAEQLADGAAVDFLHVLPETGAAMSPEGVTASMVTRERLTRDVGDALEARVSALTGGDATKGNVAIEAGAAVDVIIQQAKARRSDLVVVGRAGAGLASGGAAAVASVAGRLLGSVAAAVVQDSPCSVMVARRPIARPPGKVVVALDLREDDASNEAVWRVAAAHASRWGAGLVLLHSLDLPAPIALADPAVAAPLIIPGEATDERVGGAQQRLRALLGQARIPGEILVVEEAPAAAILRTAEATDATLVVIGASKAGLSRLVLGSVAAAVVTRSPCNVLVVRQSSPPG